MMPRNRPACNDRQGVTIHKADKCSLGYTLYWGRKEGRASLIDMDGRIVHEWMYGGDSIWHHADMLQNGNLIALINDGCLRHFNGRRGLLAVSLQISRYIWCSGLNGARHLARIALGGYRPDINIGRRLVEVDWDSNLVWSDPVHVHHDARRLSNGNTLVVAHDRAQYLHISPRVHLYDYLQEITPDNKVVWEWHAATHVDELKDLVDVVARDWAGDWPHINTVEALPDTPLGREDERFRMGNILVSPRHLHCIFIIEKESGKIVWAWGPGEILGQHQPTMLGNGNILLFDNGHGNDAAEDRDYSRVIEIQPATGEIVWKYQADPPEAFWSPVGSGQQRLPNGNTLICAMNWSETGRIFEVTPTGEIVWEFWDPEAQALYRAARYSPAWVEPLLSR